MREKINKALANILMADSLDAMRTAVEALALTRRSLEVLYPDLMDEYDNHFTETVNYYFTMFKDMDQIELLNYMDNRLGGKK